MKTLHALVLVFAAALFLYAAALVDHGDDLWGNGLMITNIGLAAVAAAFHPWVRAR